MTANAFSVRRILAGAAALLMLQWNALAFDAGGVSIGTGGFDRLAPAGHADPFVLSESGPPPAAKERPSPDKEPPSAEGAAITADRAEGISAGQRPFIAPFGEAASTGRLDRAFNARAPPSRA